MDTETYEQVSLSADEVGDARDYLKENTEVDVLYIDGAPVGGRAAELRRAGRSPGPIPGVRGDTAQGGTKPATLETGAVVQVPLFLNEGDVVKVDTRTGEYLGRVAVAGLMARRAARRRRGGPTADERTVELPGGSATLLGELGLTEIEVEPAACGSACDCSAAPSLGSAAAGRTAARRAGGRRARRSSLTSSRRRPWSRSRRRWSAPSIAPRRPTADPVRAARATW